jgi:hypothetical protein
MDIVLGYNRPPPKNAESIMPRATMSFAAATVALLLACTAGQQIETGGVPRGALTSKDLEEYAQLDLYTALERERPRWLRQRSAVSVTGPVPVVVYIDNIRMGGVEVLRNVSVDALEWVRFVSASDATTRFGLGVVSGVIEVTTKSGRS